MHQPPLRVFVSSTRRDLQPEREAVEAALPRLRASMVFTGMEHFGSRDENTRRASLDEVDRSHIYVGIFAARYGSGITEAEYRRAREHNLPCFIYFKTESTITLDKVEMNPAQVAKRDKLKADLRQAHTVTEFNSPDELATKVLGDLHRWIFDEYIPQAADSHTPRPPHATLHQLRAPVSDFVGREKEIEALVDALRKGESAGISGISGMGGIGKTELALLVANRLRPEYPDAQLLIDMRGTDEKPLATADALASCIRAFAGADAQLPEALDELVKLYRSNLDGKRALILLDNAADSAQARPLLPPSGCALLVTSRETLALPGMKRLRLEQLQPQEARDLLTRIAPRTPPDIADRICHLCGYLPLALRAAGSLLDITTDLDPATYATQLHDERERLKLIGKEGVDLDVEASFELSYARLPPDTALVFRQLAVFPASFDAAAEEEICQDAGHAHLSNLLRRNLVLYNTETARYRLHDLARLFADSRLSDDERYAGQARHATHYSGVLGETDKLYKQGTSKMFMRGLALFDAEWTNIQAGHLWAERHVGDNDMTARLCSQYPNNGAFMLSLRLHPRERINWLEKALSAARELGDRPTEAHHLGNLGNSYDDLDEPRRALEFHKQSLAIYREIGNRQGEGNELGNLGLAYADLGEPRRAIELYEQVLIIARETGDPHSEGNALGSLGSAHSALGDPSRAIEFHEQDLTIRRKIGDRRGEGDALNSLGLAYADLGEPHRAVELYEQALAVRREIADRRGEAVGLWNMSLMLDKLGDRKQAVAYAEMSLKIREDIEDTRVDEVRKQLEEWRGKAG